MANMISPKQDAPHMVYRLLVSVVAAIGMQVLLIIALILSPFVFLFFAWTGIAMLGTVFCFFMWICTDQHVYLRGMAIMFECGIPSMLVAGVGAFLLAEMKPGLDRRRART